MNFFKLYIGDYLRDTGTLTLAQHGAYVLMLMHHYANEAPLPVGRELYRLLRADTKLEREAIDFVAAKFWITTDAGLINERSGKEFSRANQKSEKNREIALAREAKKRAQKEHDDCTNQSKNVDEVEHENNTNRARNVLETCHDQSTIPDTRHQTPDLNPSCPELFAQDVEVSTVEDFQPLENQNLPTPRVSTVKYSDEDFELASWMWEKIRALYPEDRPPKPPKLESWADEIRKIRQHDKRRIEDIRDLFAWANADSFWCTNIRSPEKLRSQWDQLVILMAKRPGAVNGFPQASSTLSPAGQATAAALDVWMRRQEEKDLEENAKIGP